MSAKHWGGSHLEVQNSNSISCSNGSLLECSPVTQAGRVRFPAETCLSRGALVENGDDLGKPLHIVFFSSKKVGSCSGSEFFRIYIGVCARQNPWRLSVTLLCFSVQWNSKIIIGQRDKYQNLLDSSKPSDDSFPVLGVGVFAKLLHADLHAGQCWKFMLILIGALLFTHVFWYCSIT